MATPPTFPASADLAEGTGTRAFSAVATTAGDYLVVDAIGEDGALANITPSAAGLTFTLQNNVGTAGARTRVQQWTAPDATGASRTVTMTASVAGRNYRARITVVRGSAGPGTGKNASAAGQTVSVTRQDDNSAMFMAVGDWNTGAVGSPTWVPGGATQASQQGVAGTYIIGRWDDSGVAGTGSHGISSPSYGAPSVAVMEMLGVAGSDPDPVANPQTELPPHLLLQLAYNNQAMWRAGQDTTAQASVGDTTLSGRNQTLTSGFKNVTSDTDTYGRTQTLSSTLKGGTGTTSATQHATTTATILRATTGGTTTTQRTTTTTAVRKQTAQPTTLVGHTTNRATTLKGGVAAGAATQHHTTIAATLKAALGLADIDQRAVARSFGASVAGIAGPSLTHGRTSTASTGRKGATPPGVVVQRSTAGTTVIKRAAGTGVAPTHTLDLATTRKQAIGVGQPTTHTHTQSAAFTPPNGPASASQRATSASAGRKGGIVPASAQQRTTDTTSVRKTAQGVGRPTTHTTTLAAVLRRALGNARASARALTQATFSAGFEPARYDIEGGLGTTSVEGTATTTGVDGGAIPGAMLDQGSSAGHAVD